ncbi:MAG: TOTE conflict system archaeo-eukaryotic primase domain-containing protein [Vicinamibacterales bacterium]
MGCRECYSRRGDQVVANSVPHTQPHNPKKSTIYCCCPQHLKRTVGRPTLSARMTALVKPNAFKRLRGVLKAARSLSETSLRHAAHGTGPGQIGGRSPPRIAAADTIRKAPMDLRSVTHASPAEAEIGLFRSLFRGRVDVYPRRFESRTTGRSGYAPTCANEWVRGISESRASSAPSAPIVSSCRSLTHVIRWHLSGHGPDGQPFVAGRVSAAVG